MTHIYPATLNGATHEMVALYNNTAEAIEITNWCITNKNEQALVCFKSQVKDGFFIDGYTRVAVASEEYVATLDEQVFIDRVFTVANKTSGSLVGSNDTVRLKDAVGRTVSEFSWTSTAVKGSGYIRTSFNDETRMYSTESRLESLVAVVIAGGGLRLEPRAVDDTQEAAIDTDQLRLSEILANPTGADAGNEFIELYNSGSATVLLDMYALRVTGGSSDKTFTFPDGLSLEPDEYYAIYDTEVKFSLNNTAGAVSLLRSGDGASEEDVVDAALYRGPKEGYSWAYFNEDESVDWIYTSRPTPNQPNLKDEPVEQGVKVSQVKTCSEDQYRNPETGRCKKKGVVAVAASCKIGQYRSEETGRCRNVATAKIPTDCKQGQERNPETNRCRNSKQMTKAGHGVEVKPTITSGGVAWYAWVLVGVIVVGVLAYGAWEWRGELYKIWQKLRQQKG
ncbi:lamin tail domain-containing protein [Candidatus Saccharibacteria bacterium TM7i]|nr:lamin tail domain-containing protein [Candidatus Saccharibacteria bacterium TM7i]